MNPASRLLIGDKSTSRQRKGKENQAIASQTTARFLRRPASQIPPSTSTAPPVGSGTALAELVPVSNAAANADPYSADSIAGDKTGSVFPYNVPRTPTSESPHSPL